MENTGSHDASIMKNQYYAKQGSKKHKIFLFFLPLYAVYVLFVTLNFHSKIYLWLRSYNEKYLTY